MIINLTQHPASPEQREAGVFDLEGDALCALKRALTFDDLPTAGEILQRAREIVAIARETGAKKAMIGGAPYLMSELELALLYAGITPLYAFSRRESEETVQPDGSVKKQTVFRHIGFVEVGQ